MIRPLPRQRPQVRAHAEEPLLEGDLPRAPPQVGQVTGVGPGRGARCPRRSGSVSARGMRMLGLGAEGRLLEAEVEVVAQVGAAARAAARRPKSVAEAEEVAEDVAEVGEDGGIEAGPPAAPPNPAWP